MSEQPSDTDARLTAVFERLDRKFDDIERTVDNGFAEMRGTFDQMAAGQQAIVDLLNTAFDRRDQR